MYEFKHQTTPADEPDELVDTVFADRRSGIERRKDSAPGYTFISSVGWICRRERFRRKQDPDTWACCTPW
jgi:hypothetical protein